MSAHDSSDYFNDRVEDIRARIPHPSTGASVFGATMPSYSGQGFSELESISLDDLTKVIMASRPTTCSLDPLPAWVIKDLRSTLGAYVLSILNLSLLNGVFPPCFKSVVVKPLLNKNQAWIHIHWQVIGLSLTWPFCRRFLKKWYLNS